MHEDEMDENFVNGMTSEEVAEAIYYFEIELFEDASDALELNVGLANPYYTEIIRDTVRTGIANFVDPGFHVRLHPVMSILGMDELMQEITEEPYPN